MSSQSSTNPIPGYELRADPLPPSRSFWQQVAVDTFGNWRPFVGVAWIAILAFVAVFAPFLANSFPLLMKSGGHWSSPALRHFSSVDLILLVGSLTVAVLLLLRRLSIRQRVAILLLTLAVVAALALRFIQPPHTVVYDHYRELHRDGAVQWSIHAPIPYSASDRQRDLPGSRMQAPSRHHLLGTDINGADVLSRMIHACRIALAIGFISTGIAVSIGVIIGGIMGFFVGRVDMFGMRLIEIFQAIPTLFLLIAIVAFFGRNLYLMMAIIGFVSWTGYARFVRAEFLRLRNQDFVQAAIAAGLPLRSILFRHMLPNGIAPVLVSASFGVASAILAESTLSFLGLGLVDEPSWGQLLEQARSASETFKHKWWLAVFPGLAIFLTVFAYNLVGEALRDAIDPKLRGK